MDDLSFQKPRICILGCGRIGALHARNLRGRAALYFCSRSRVSAQKFYTTFHGHGMFGDLNAVLASDIDAVVIASPPDQHKDQVVALLAAGKAVLVEKPMCVSPEELAEIDAALAQVESPLLMVAENYYYKPSLARLKHMIARGHIGEVLAVSVKKLAMQQARGWRSAYGALLEGGIHFVALISDLFDAAPEEVEAVFPGYSGRGAERESILRMVYGNGACGELHYSWQTRSLTKGLFQHSHIDGTHGRIAFESNGLYIYQRGVRIALPGLKDLMGYRAMTTDFLACLHNRTRAPYSNFARAKRELQIVFEAYRESVVSGQSPQPLPAKGHHHTE